MRKITNISISEYRQFLKQMGCTYLRTTGGHELWSKENLPRPLTFQTHIEPIPAFIIKQHLRYLDITTRQFLDFMDNL